MDTLTHASLKTRRVYASLILRCVSRNCGNLRAETVILYGVEASLKVLPRVRDGPAKHKSILPVDFMVNALHPFTSRKLHFDSLCLQPSPASWTSPHFTQGILQIAQLRCSGLLWSGNNLFYQGANHDALSLRSAYRQILSLQFVNFMLIIWTMSCKAVFAMHTWQVQSPCSQEGNVVWEHSVRRNPSL